MRAVLANRELTGFPHELREANLYDPSCLQSQDIADSDLSRFLFAFCAVWLFRASFFPQPFSTHFCDITSKPWNKQSATIERLRIATARHSSAGAKPNTSSNDKGFLRGVTLHCFCKKICVCAMPRVDRCQTSL